MKSKCTCSRLTFDAHQLKCVTAALLGGWLCCVGCAPGTTLRGYIVDEQGEPLARGSLVAKKVEPQEGYEDVEAELGSAGEFQLKGLFPVSEYTLLPRIEDWSGAPLWSVRFRDQEDAVFIDDRGWATDTTLTVKTASNRVKRVLEEPLVVEPVGTTLRGQIIVERSKLGDATVVLDQIHPVEGYERFTTRTKEDRRHVGTFSVEGLFPNAEYTVSVMLHGRHVVPSWTVTWEDTGETARFDKAGRRDGAALTIRTGPNLAIKQAESALLVRPFIAGLTGVLRTRDGEPPSNATILAQQVPPVAEGYEVFEVHIDENGRFGFDTLMPDADYRLYVRKPEGKQPVGTVTAPAQGEWESLPPPLMPGLLAGVDGVVSDAATGLEWAPDHGKDVNWAQAKAYANDLTLGGHDDWRLPTIEELATLYWRDLGIQYGLHPALRLDGGCVWSSTRTTRRRVACFMFTTGFATDDDRANWYSNRVLPVRAAAPDGPAQEVER